MKFIVSGLIGLALFSCTSPVSNAVELYYCEFADMGLCSCTQKQGFVVQDSGRQKVTSYYSNQSKFISFYTRGLELNLIDVSTNRVCASAVPYDSLSCGADWVYFYSFSAYDDLNYSRIAFNDRNALLFLQYKSGATTCIISDESLPSLLVSLQAR